MKKFLLLLLIPFFGFAKYYPGSITLNDGTYKSGLVDVPLNSYNQTIGFKSDRFGKFEKFTVNEVKEFDVSVDGGMVYFVTTYIGDLKKDNTVKRATNKHFMRVVKEGNLKLYVLFTMTSNNDTGEVYIKRPNEEVALQFYMWYGQGVYSYKTFQKVVKRFFEDSCPGLLDAMNEKEFDEKGLPFIVELYDKTCGKP